MKTINPEKESVNPALNELARLYQIFGRVVFLVLPRGQKELESKSWEKLTFEDTQKLAYQRELLQALSGEGNLAVRLGPSSDGLRAIDVDRKDRVEEFLSLNPQLRDTVQVHGRKGCQFFFRLFPGTPFPTKNNKAVVTFKCDDGGKFGEWRFGETGGAYSMIDGRHPDDGKISWRIEGEVVRVLTFADIKWPPDVPLPWPETAGKEQSSGGDDAPLEYIPPELEKRIKAYLACCPPSVAGKGGDEALFKAAYRVANGFALDEEQTCDSLERWFNPFCKPPWNEERLRYKAGQAQKVEHKKPRGYLLAADPGYPPLAERPCFRVYHDFWNNGERLRAPGVFYHTATKETQNNPASPDDHWICAPLKVLATTATREDIDYGWLVEFTSRNGRRKRCAIPARWFASNGNEVLGELLSLGLKIVHSKERALVLQYIATSQPEKRFAAALSTGWHDDKTFVLPNEVIGKKAVWYQGKDEANPYAKAGTFEHWKTKVAARAHGNSNLIVALCGAFAGPLFHLFKVSGGGLHWFGHTTVGKTTVLETSQSVWGGPNYRRGWDATAVGLQAIAMLHTDTLLVLDEIHMVDPKVLDSAIYALINGHGKSRGNIHAASRPMARWRVLVLSSGEVASETLLSAAGFAVRAGQTVRILDIPVEGKHGAFDELHGFKGGAEFSDALRESAAQDYGHAGLLFVCALIDARAAGELDLSARLVKTQKSFEPANELQRRAMRVFAILALAGELATEWKLLPWKKGEATTACVTLFERWQKQVRFNAAGSPERRILAVVANFIDRFGDDRFSNIYGDEEKNYVRDRAGYWLNEPLSADANAAITWEQKETRRIYLFTASGLREATKGHDFRQVLDALDAAGAFVRKGPKESAVSHRTPKGKERLYFIDSAKLE